LIAEEVAEANPSLVVHNKKGELLSVRYDQINAMLLNEFLKAHRKLEEQEATVAQLRSDFQTMSAQQQEEIRVLRVQLREQAAQIQKVSVQVEVSNPAPKVVINKP
jgi:uncharacterized protein involved in exopolysaccharide biosynthesis